MKLNQQAQFTPYRILIFAFLFVLILSLACGAPKTENYIQTQVALNVQATDDAQSKTQTAVADAKQQKEISDQQTQTNLIAQVTETAQADAQVQETDETPVDVKPTSSADIPPSPVAAFPIVDSGQIYCYDNVGSIPCPTTGQPFYGQDAQYRGNAPSYNDNSDGTITDNITGLMWQREANTKMSYSQAVAGAESFNLAGYDDWRLPTIKEMYSLILFSGYDVSELPGGSDTSGLIPFVDDVFAFEYGDTKTGEQIHDSKYVSSSIYTGAILGGQQAVFAANFAEGSVKGYTTGQETIFSVLYVRGNSSSSNNDFVDNGNGTILDNATSLTWTQDDSRKGLDWEQALNYCESLDFAGISRWRLPNVKELQSIVDFSRAPDATNSAAIDPLFNVTSITNQAGQIDYPYYWSSTTHANMQNGVRASYVSFGRALGYMNNQWIDVHGAGAQRSDPKSGDSSEWPNDNAIRINNYARCVTGGVSDEIFTGGEIDPIIGIFSPGTGQSGDGAGFGEILLPNNGPAVPNIPSPAAIDACNSLSAGSPCTFNTPFGSTSGSCTEIAIPNLAVLACIPGLP